MTQQPLRRLTYSSPVWRFLYFYSANADRLVSTVGLAPCMRSRLAARMPL